MRSRPACLAACLLLLAAAACAEFPKPFKPEDKATAPPILYLSDSPGIVLGPVDGLAPAVAEALLSAMIEAFADANVPASRALGNRASYRLDGRVVAAPRDGAAKILVLWELYDPEGTKIGAHLQHEELDDSALVVPVPATMARVASAAAPRIAAFIQDGEAPPPKQAPAAKVAVLPIEGAPGDGRAALARALRFYLGQAAFEITNEPTEDGLVVLGTVEIGEVTGASQPITILWQVLRPDGYEIGQVDQSNKIPVGLLDGPWGSLAFVIAEGAAQGIKALLAREMAGAVP